jgi:hypothetical protein
MVTRRSLLRFLALPTALTALPARAGSIRLVLDGSCLTAERAVTNAAGQMICTSVEASTVARSSAVTHGQQITAAMVGRAAAEGLANFAALTTRRGATFNTTQTVRNVNFTGEVSVTSGTVTFEYCTFTSSPTAKRAALLQYNGGKATGTVICNYCDFDSGLRGNAGNFETCGFQAGQRGFLNPATIGKDSAFTLYRCRIEGFGNNVGVHKYQNQASKITECLLVNGTLGGGSHVDGIEIYSSDNLTVERCRIALPTTNCQSCINIAPMDIPFPSPGNPIGIVNCYIDGGIAPILTRWSNQGIGTNSAIYNVSYIGNRFGDASAYGRECDFQGMDVTFDAAYAKANPSVIYWARDNVWAPNGEGVTNSAKAPSGDASAGLPHTPGSFIDQRNFFGGEMFVWNGRVRS